MKSKNNIDILFLDGLEERYLVETPTFLGFIFPIASVLEDNGFTYKIFNISTLLDYSAKGLVDELKSISFKTIGISTNADNIRIVYEIVSILKEDFPNVPVILGGPQATYSSFKLLKELECDVVVRHEGEYKLVKILEFFIKGLGRLDDIKGISFRNNLEIIETKDDIAIDINNLPIPKYEILTNSDYWHIPSNSSFENFDDFLGKIKFYNNIFLTGRGCPYKCSFCVEGNIKSKFRLRNAELVEKDLRHYLKILKVKYFLIGDDTFTSNLKRVKEIAEILKKLRQEFDFVWFAEGRVNVLCNHPEMLQIMVDSGLYKLQLGIESGNQKVLDTYNKKITIEQIKKVVKQASKYSNLLIHGNLILGNPHETYNEFLQSIEFAKHLIKISEYKMDFACGYLTPFVGTDIRENPEKYGILILNEDFEHNSTSFTQITCKPDTISLNELQNLLSKTENEFTKYYRNNIWNLPKQEIDKKWQFDIVYGGEKTGVISRSWSKSVYSLLSLQKYYSLFYQSGYKKSSDSNIDCKELIPLRLWDLEFDIVHQHYRFISLKGEEIIIQGNDIFLYECAVGNYSIVEILELEGSPLKIDSSAIQYATNFYKSLEDNFALIFKEY